MARKKRFFNLKKYPQQKMSINREKVNYDKLCHFLKA